MKLSTLLTSGRLVTLGAAVVCLLLGCRSEDQVLTYQIPKVKPPHRMLGAILPQGERAWFFKLAGAYDSVAEQADRFRTFIESVRFGEGPEAEPTWTLPAGWQQLPGNSMRFATIEITTDEAPLEVSVTVLPLPPQDGILTNVNRWRGQMGLSPLSRAGLAADTTSVKAGDVTATIVELVGKQSAGGPMAAPFAKDGGPSSLPTVSAESAEPASAANLTFEAPPHWKPGELVVSRGGFSVPRDAAFIVNEGGQKAEITITSMPAAAGDLVPNFNRWRSQVGLEALSAEKLAAETTKTEVGGAEGHYVRFAGPEQSVLGIIAEQGGKAWFIKLQGDRELATKLQPEFEAFVRSIKF